MWKKVITNKDMNAYPKNGVPPFFIEIYERKITMKYLITMLLNKKCKNICLHTYICKLEHYLVRSILSKVFSSCFLQTS